MIYISEALQYMTTILFVMSILGCVNIIITYGHIEGWNILVWIGRSMLCLSGIAAICLLSTSSLDVELASNNVLIYYLRYLVYLLNDIFSIATCKITRKYDMISSITTALNSVVWSLVSPVQHFASIDRQCEFVLLDFLIKCDSGSLNIASRSRFYGLLGLICGSCLVCFLFEFKYDSNPSALLTGIVAIEIHRVLYLFDIKTWRFFSFPLPHQSQPNLLPHISYAIPPLK
ncbi:hypothetical protein THRCLA_22622 [Thraustotheca clavata]|uniref:Uncharacterized protein n=1 Tax=Thraustotheca clavata TaxID=74557 RepID=A0A1V9YVM6_9STRA|nr:hypothetical protein THRCLA_22622 [Thraustotheca clavata]